MSNDTGWSLEVGYRSDPGRQRSLNQDSYLILAPPAVAPDVDALLAVADGMGGHQAGEVASGTVVMALDRWFASGEYRQHVAYSPQHDDYFVVVLKELLEVLNEQTYELAARGGGLAGMGTTATVALIRGAHFFLGHVGDSRAYLLRGDQLHRLTHDHSWVAEQVQSGQMSPAEAAHHPRRNVLTRALGQGPVVRVDRGKYDLQPGDLLLLCSDGLSGIVAEETLRQALAGASSVQAACDQLVALANQQGGPDNITVVAARFQPGERSSNLPSGRVVGPQDRYRSIGARVADTLRLRRRPSPGMFPFGPGLVRGVLLALGLLFVAVTGWGLGPRLVVKDGWPLAPGVAMASMMALGFGLGVLMGWIVWSRPRSKQKE